MTQELHMTMQVHRVRAPDFARELRALAALVQVMERGASTSRSSLDWWRTTRNVFRATALVGVTAVAVGLCRGEAWAVHATPIVAVLLIWLASMIDRAVYEVAKRSNASTYALSQVRKRVQDAYRETFDAR